VTSEEFWHHPGEMELQCVPGRFESAKGYVRVFEPLLFEECCAQLYSTWEEFCDTVSRDAYSMVCVKNVDQRERGDPEAKGDLTGRVPGTVFGFDQQVLLHSEAQMKSCPHPERPGRLQAIAASFRAAAKVSQTSA